MPNIQINFEIKFETQVFPKQSISTNFKKTNTIFQRQNQNQRNRTNSNKNQLTKQIDIYHQKNQHSQALKQS